MACMSTRGLHAGAERIAGGGGWGGGVFCKPHACPVQKASLGSCVEQGTPPRHWEECLVRFACMCTWWMYG